MPLAKDRPYCKSERLTIYSKLAMVLIDKGKAYPCVCMPEELEEMKAKMEANSIPHPAPLQ